jgi:hypothetical protein
MSKNRYMHLINERPGMYHGNQQIVYISHWDRVSFDDMFVNSLATIRKQQEATRAWRAAQGFSDDPPDKYSYLRIKFDE